MSVGNFLEDTGKRDLLLELLSIGGISLLSVNLASLSSFTQITLLFLTGFTAFGFLEYCIHRFAFHLKTKRRHLRELVYKIHGVHHQYPSDQRYYKTSVYMKVGAVLVVNALGYVAGAGAGLVLCSGFGCGYAFYLGIHFIVHHFPPPGGPLRYFWVYHEIHHHINSKKAYGVSNPFWDLVFNTYPKKWDFQKAYMLLDT